MEKSAFNGKLADLSRYSLAEKSDIRQEKNKYPYCVLLQMMDILSDKAISTPQWESRFLPHVLMYRLPGSRLDDYLRRVTLEEVLPQEETKPEADQGRTSERVAPRLSQSADEDFDIMKEINAYQEVSFKTAPKSVILSKFLETGNYSPDELGTADSVPVEVLGKKSVAVNDSLETETLALVLEKQGKFDKAVEVYEKLIAKNPEKSSTFALRISELKIKIENNKK